MEDYFWPDENYATWNCTQTEDSSFTVPWLSPDAAAALQYNCHNPAAVVPPWAPPVEGFEEDRSVSASRSHSEAEKRRRDRINSHLSTLRKLIPKSEKMDKAALLGQVVDHVKEQSKRAKEVSKHSAIPSETDEVIIEELNNADCQETRIPQDINGRRSMYVKASVCCDDRPELIGELNMAIKGLGLTIFRVEITSLGGRMKIDFVLFAKDQNVINTSALKLALSRVVLSSGMSGYSMRSKRQRFFYPN